MRACVYKDEHSARLNASTIRNDGFRFARNEACLDLDSISFSIDEIAKLRETKMAMGFFEGWIRDTCFLPQRLLSKGKQRTNVLSCVIKAVRRNTLHYAATMKTRCVQPNSHRFCSHWREYNRVQQELENTKLELQRARKAHIHMIWMR